MKKALEILREYRSLQFGWNDTGKREEISEAIADIEKFKENMKSLTDGVVSNRQGFWEAMEQRTCEGCRYGAFGVKGLGFEVECRIGYNCSRGREDRYELKDNK